MSGEENPFRKFDENPFKDQEKSASVRQDALTDFNPFDRTEGGRNPSAYAPQPAQNVVASNLEDLERRQRELDERAEALRNREADLAAVEIGQKNWPPLPDCCPCKPCFYQDIDIEIHGDYKNIVRYGYYFWLAYVIHMILNTIGALAYLCVDTANSASGTTFGLSLLRLIVCSILAYLFWFRAMYNAFKNNSSFYFFEFFIVSFFQIIDLTLRCLGIPFWSSCGFINGARLASNGNAATRGVGAFMLFLACIWVVLTVINVLILFRVHHIYRTTGASFAKAKQELTQGVASDSRAQAAAIGIAGEAAKASARNRQERF